MIIDISNAFEDNNFNLDSSKIIPRIIDSYKKSKLVQEKLPPIYQVSREWLPIYMHYMNEIIELLNSENIDIIKKKYENFFRDKLSTGLHGLHFDMVSKYMTPGKQIENSDLSAYMNLCKINAELFNRSNPSVSLEKLLRPAIGNPYGYNLDGKKIFINSEYHYHYSSVIKKLLKREDSIVFELGGGYGGMAYYLMRDNPSVTYIALDLPENTALQAYYLMSNFPDKKIGLYGEFDFNEINYRDYDALILPNFAIEHLKTNEIDLSFNSYSLSEMSYETIDNYINHICRITSKYFFHINHVYWEMSADYFPIDFNKFELFMRFPTMWNKDKDNFKLDHHEYIYICKNID